MCWVKKSVYYTLTVRFSPSTLMVMFDETNKVEKEAFYASEIKENMKEQKMDLIHYKPYHPQTQGKIERYHRSMKNVVKLNHYYLPWDLEEEIEKFVEYNNNEHYHDSLDNVPPAAVFFGWAKRRLNERKQIK